MDIIEKLPDKPWDWEHISNNPNITMEIIEYKIDFSELSQNKFTYQNKLNNRKKGILALKKQKTDFQKMLICILLNTTCKIINKKFEYWILIYFFGS